MTWRKWMMISRIQNLNAELMNWRNCISRNITIFHLQSSQVSNAMYQSITNRINKFLYCLENEQLLLPLSTNFFKYTFQQTFYLILYLI